MKAPEATRTALARTVMLGHWPSDAAPDLALRLARANGVGLEFARHLPDGPIRQEEEARGARFRTRVLEASALLGAARIEHIIFKCDRHYVYYDSNVDVIVRPGDWPHARRALQVAGYRGNVMFKEPDKVMFSRPGDPTSVHLHAGVTWNGVPYFDDDALWRRSVRDPLLPERRRLDGQDELAVNLAHNLFENYEVSLGDALYFRRALAAAPALDDLEIHARCNGWLGGLGAALAHAHSLAEDWATSERTGHVTPRLANFPYRLPRSTLAQAYSERITANVRARHLRRAAREAYAYPTFYALWWRHDLFGRRV
jgi:hypothetical protein